MQFNRVENDSRVEVATVNQIYMNWFNHSSIHLFKFWQLITKYLIAEHILIQIVTYSFSMAHKSLWI